MDLGKFSVVSTNVQVDAERQLIKKTYSLNVDLELSIFKIKQLMDGYLDSISRAKIEMPEVLNSYIDDNLIVYETRYAGKNIVELGLSVDTFEDFVPHIKKMAQLVKKAINHNIYFDPHPKNFVFNDDLSICYVDFFPPYSDYLVTKRLEVAADEDKQIISENFSFFTRDFLAAHFCGDFLNIDPRFDSCFTRIYSILLELGMVKDAASDFSSLATKIRQTEDRRIQRKIYLL